MSKFDSYLAAVSEAMKQNPQWRSGQAHFNVLYEMYPDLANEIRSGKMDPFYQDKRIVEFLGFVSWQLKMAK